MSYGNQSTIFEQNNIIITRSHLIHNMYVRLATAPGGATSRTFTIYLNGVATAITVTIAGASTTGNNTANSINVVVGDTIACFHGPNVGAPAASAGQVSIEVES